MEVTAQMVKELRTRTGAGIMDCKDALKENGGDFEEAVRYLREKGLSSAAKKAGREASEGQVYASVSADARTGAIVEVNCETDFVARTEDFRPCSRRSRATWRKTAEKALRTHCTR